MNLQDIFTKFISACALKKKFEKAVGVYIGNENILCVHVNFVHSEDNRIGQWKVIDIAGINLYVADKENLHKLAAEKVAELCKVKEWQTTNIALCIDSAEIVTDIEDLSNIPKDKIPASVRYQIAVTGNFDADTYLYSFMETDFGIWMEGISKINAHNWIMAFRNNGLELLTLTTMPNEIENIEGIDLSNIDSEFLERGGIKAVFAARSLVCQTNPNFLMEQATEIKGWNFKRITAAIVIITFCVTIGIAAFDFWECRQVEIALEREREQLALLESDRRKEEFINKDLAELKNKNQIISDLSKNAFPWRGLLVHFGSIKINGVWLREMRTLENKSIEIKGEAVSYEAVASYVEALENDRDIFSKVELKNSETQPKSQFVQFTVNLTL